METIENQSKNKKSFGRGLVLFLAILAGLFLLTLIIVPFFIKGKLVDYAKSEINKNLNAVVDFEDARLTFFRSFPSLTLDLKQISVINKVPFEGDTLFYAEAVSLTLDAISVFRDEQIEIKRIDLHQPMATLITNKEGAVNWDIVPVSDPTEDSANISDTDPFVMNLRSIRLHNGRLAYIDHELELEVFSRDVSGTVSGRFSEDEALLTTELKAVEFDLWYENFAWLKNIKLNYQAIINADFENSIYTLNRNSIYLNDLALTGDGSFGFTDNGLMILLTFETIKSDFKSLLSLVPVIYAKEFDQVHTNGQFSLTGSVKGNYSDESLPGFKLDLEVYNADFKYPDLPVGVHQINIDLKIDNRTGDPDATILALNKFDFEIENNPFRSKLLLKTPISNPDFDATINGKLDFEQLSQAFHFEEREHVNGNMQFDVSLKGNMQAVEANDLNQITAMGSLLARDINIQSGAFALPLSISQVQLNVSPAYLDLVNMQSNIGKSDINLSGRIQDYLPYYLNDDELTGNLRLKSKLLDTNELMSVLQTEGDEEAQPDTATFELNMPERIDFRFNAEIDKLVYEQFELDNASASLHYKNKKLEFAPLSAELIGGTLNMNGSFDGADIENPMIDINFGINKFDIPLAYSQIGIMQQLAPVAEKTSGDFSTGFKMRAKLDRDLNPVYESIVGGGNLQTSRLVIQASDILVRLADMLGNDDYKRLVTDGLNFSYEFVNGRVFQKPVGLSYAGSQVTIGGSVGFDQSIDYEMLFQMPFSKIGRNLAGQITDLVNQGGTLRVALNPDTPISVIARLTGDVRSPRIELDYRNFASNLRSTLEEQARQALQQQKEEAVQRVRQEADRIMQQARDQAAQIMQQAESTAANIRSEASRAAEKLRSEAEAQAQRVEQEGKQKGMVAEMAARETARRMRNEADNAAQKLINEADKRANEVVQQARNRSDSIIKNAQEQVDRLQ